MVFPRARSRLVFLACVLVPATLLLFVALRSLRGRFVGDALPLDSSLLRPAPPIPEPKYFHESSDRFHADRRYAQDVEESFNGSEELIRRHCLSSLHAVFEAWSRFAQQHQIEHWVAHGSLLGWFWGQKIMPFDDDIDIQMKASELVRLVPFNMTMIAPFILLDVNPHFHDRTTYPGNPNVIDARVIDTRTGYFMDITGLAPVHPSPQGPFGSSAVVWQCKSPWQYRAADLFPLVPTHFEGFATFRPRNYHGALVQEYPAYRVPSFRSYVFDFAERAWVLASSSNLSQLNRIPPLSFLLWSFWVEASALSMLLKLSIGFLLILLLAMLALLVALSRTSTRIAKAARNK